MRRARLTAGLLLRLLATGGSLTVLGACADYFTNHPPPGGAVAWQGTSTAAAQRPPESMPDTSCGPMRLELFVADAHIGGRGYLAGKEPSGWVDRLNETWWAEGDLYPNGVVLFTLRRQSATPVRMRPDSVWRGSYNDERIVAVEQPRSCDREVVLRPVR